jgi:hypothetical protein
MNNYFLVSCNGEVILTFQEKILTEKLPSELTFAHGILNKIRLSSLTYGIVCERTCHLRYQRSPDIEARLRVRNSP